jgi:hypothetical protein
VQPTVQPRTRTQTYTGRRPIQLHRPTCRAEWAPPRTCNGGSAAHGRADVVPVACPMERQTTCSGDTRHWPWSGSVTRDGRSRVLTTRCAAPCSAATYCAPGDQSGLEQETWALLTLHQLVRMAMVDAIEAQPGTDPDRASFTSALEAARDQLTAAAGICPDDRPGQPGVIGRAVLATLLPARRPRYSARIVKCSTSRYHENDDSRPRLPAAVTAIDITVHTPPLGSGAPSRARYSARAPRPDQPSTRRERITEIMTSQPPRGWSGHELALLLGVKPCRRQAPQHAHPARRVGQARPPHGTYALNTPSPPSSTTAPGP